MLKHTILFVICFYTCSNLFGQHSSFVNYNVESGLPFETIFTCLEDNDGYMWFSSSHGVARFDGQNWMYLTSDDGLSDNDVLSMFLDEGGRIWFATFNGELSYYFNGRVFNSEDHLLFKLNKIENGIASIFEDSKKVKWLNPINNIQSSIDDYGFNTYKLPNEFDNSLRGFIFEIRNEIYLFSRNNIFKLVNGEFIESNQYSLPLNWRSYLYKKDDKSLIYLTDRGIVKLSESGQTSVLIPSEELPNWKTIGDIYITKDDELSVSTINNGVFIFNNYKKFDYSNNHILYNQSITDCLEDLSGNIWYTTVNNGVFFIPSNYEFNHLLSEEERLKINKINSFELENDGTLWIGSDDGFLFKKTENTFEKIDLNRFPSINSIVYNQINDIIISNENLIISTNNGLISINKNNINDIARIRRSNGYTYSPKNIIIDKAGTITTTLSHGVFKVERDINDLMFLSRIPDIPILRNFSHAIADDGTIWYVSRDGVHNNSTSNTKFYDVKEFGITQRVKEIELLNDSTFVLTTNGQGIFIISSGKLVIKLNKSSGLSSNSPSKIEVIDNNIWLSSNNGLDKIVIENNSVVKIHNYNEHLNINTYNVNDFFIDENKIIVCTNNDIIVIDNNWVDAPLNPPNVYINTISSGDSILKSSNIHLKKNSNLSIDCSVINFNRNSTITYEYKIVGIHETWVSTKLKHFEFTSLQPGEYTFMFRAKRTSGYWSNYASFDFEIITPLREKPIFIIGYLILIIVLILGLILLFYKMNLKKKFQKVEQNYKIKSLEQQALQAMMNPHFIFNVLNSIQYYLSSDNADEAQINLTKFAKLIRKNLEINQEKFISISEEIEYLRLYLSLEELRFDESFEYAISVDSALNPEEINIPTMLIQPFIENSIWHGIMPQGGSGSVSIEFSKKNDSLYIYVIDNGVGYNPNNLQKLSTHKSIGIKMTRERLSLMQSIYDEEFYFEIEPVKNTDSSLSGTKVTLKLPLNLF